MRGVMDAISDRAVQTVVVMTAAQVGKSEALLNAIGYYIDQDPAPILMIQPTVEMGEAFSKDRIGPMLRTTPALRHVVGDTKVRQNILHKVFPGGHVTITGANAPAGLASRPIRILLCDEVDRYPASAGVEGDPVSLAKRRTATFWNRKIVLCSTPSIKGMSRIEAEWELSDQRRFFVPCPACGERQYLVWAQVRWPEGKPREAAYVCEHCGSLWDDGTRWTALRLGEWQATAPFNGTAGFHLTEICSSWTRLGDMARAFLDAKRFPETLKTWKNTALGESHEEGGEKVDAASLEGRLEDWGDKAPNSVLVVTCGVDVQDDRLEVERVGWGLDEECWSLDVQIMYGDPSTPELWGRLDAYLRTPTVRHDGSQIPVRLTAVDTAGHFTQRAYRFCAGRWKMGVRAIKGSTQPDAPIWPERANKNNIGKVNLFSVGVTDAKATIYKRLKITEAGPGYCHFPVGRDANYFAQLTAEVLQTKFERGRAVRVFYKPPGRRNEALDMRVYAYAALHGAKIRWGDELGADMRRRGSAPAPVVAPPPAPPKLDEFSAPVEQPPASPPMPRPQAPVGFQRRIRRSGWMS